MTEVIRRIESIGDAIGTYSEISKNGQTKEIRPCMINGKLCPNLIGVEGGYCKKGLITNGRSVDCPLQKGVLTIVKK